MDSRVTWDRAKVITRRTIRPQSQIPNLLKFRVLFNSNFTYRLRRRFERRYVEEVGRACYVVFFPANINFASVVGNLASITREKIGDWKTRSSRWRGLGDQRNRNDDFMNDRHNHPSYFSCAPQFQPRRVENTEVGLRYERIESLNVQ